MTDMMLACSSRLVLRKAKSAARALGDDTEVIKSEVIDQQ